MKLWLSALLLIACCTNVCMSQNPNEVPPALRSDENKLPATKEPEAVPTPEKQSSPVLKNGPVVSGSVLNGITSGGPSRIWGSAEYLLWWVRDMAVPAPLLTQSNLADAGVLGAPSTQIALGNQNTNFGVNHGGRFVLGLWLNDERTVGVEANFFFLGQNSATSTATAALGAPNVLAIPFNNVNPNIGPAGNTAVLVTLPDLFSGNGTLTTRTSLLGTELNMVLASRCECERRVEWFGGFRYLNLDESLTYSVTNSLLGTGDFFNSRDEFNTRNHFYGGQLGARVSRSNGRWFGDFSGKVALGVMNQELAISGISSTNRFGGAIQSIPGGVFAQASNSGTTSRDRFAVVPEVSARLGYRITRNANVFVGYTFLYASDVARPGEQIDTTLNAGQAPGLAGPVPPGLQGFPARPARTFDSTDFWAHGINVGLSFRW